MKVSIYVLCLAVYYTFIITLITTDIDGERIDWGTAMTVMVFLLSPTVLAYFAGLEEKS